MSRQLFLSGLVLLLLNGCTLVSAPSSQFNSDHNTLFVELGGMEGITTITSLFVEQISWDQPHFKHFKNTNIERFRSKFAEQLCMISDGPCEYTGDTMIQVHTGMAITEKEFNRTVDLLITAMTQAGIKHTTQNKLLARLAPLRGEIILK